MKKLTLFVLGILLAGNVFAIQYQFDDDVSSIQHTVTKATGESVTALEWNATFDGIFNYLVTIRQVLENIISDSGRIGLGGITPNANLQLTVEGDTTSGGVGSDRYCDETETNCSLATSIYDTVEDAASIGKAAENCADGETLVFSDNDTPGDDTDDTWTCGTGGGAGFGTFIGYSTASDGAAGSYAAAKAVCAGITVGSTTYPDARVCVASEVAVAAMNGTVPVGAGPQTWVNNGAPGYILTLSNDCGGWNDNRLTTFGSVWVSSSNQFKIQQCNESIPFACCN